MEDQPGPGSDHVLHGHKSHFLLACEGTRPLLPVFEPETKISTLNWYFGDREQTKAIWASNEYELGVPRVVEAKWKLTTMIDEPRNTVGQGIHEEVSADSTLATNPQENQVEDSSSWQITMADNIAPIKEEGDTAPNASFFDNDESTGDRLSLETEDGDNKLDFPSSTTKWNDVFSTKDSSEKDTNDNETMTIFEVDNTFQNFISIKSPSDTVSSSGICDFTRGYWTKDENRPLYDGRKCKAFLAGMWACRGMNRPDFEYEKLRWQPDGCNLPTFTSHGFLERMKNKVIAFVGDSLGRQQFQSLMCMLTEGKDEDDSSLIVDDIAEDWGFAPVRGSLRGKGYVYRFTKTNTTVMFYWSATLSQLQHARPDEKEGWAAMHLDQPDVFLRDEIQKLDLLILNSGHHWNRGKFDGNKWRMYVDGKPLAGRKLSGIAEAYNFSIYNIVQYLDRKIGETGGKPTVFMRTLSPRHFKNGEWNTGGTCDNIRPQYGSKVIPYRGPATEKVINNAVRGSKSVRLLNVTPLSSTREEGHISKYGKGKDSGHQDCLHWCLPGVPDTWNELLYGYLAVDSSLASPTARYHGDEMV